MAAPPLTASSPSTRPKKCRKQYKKDHTLVTKEEIEDEDSSSDIDDFVCKPECEIETALGLDSSDDEVEAEKKSTPGEEQEEDYTLADPTFTHLCDSDVHFKQKKPKLMRCGKYLIGLKLGTGACSYFYHKVI